MLETILVLVGWLAGGILELWIGYRAVWMLREPFTNALIVGLARLLLGEEGAQRRKAQLGSPEGTRGQGYYWLLAGVVHVLVWLYVMGKLLSLI